MKPLRRLGTLAVRILRPARLDALRPTRPASDFCGTDRGDPVDRYYIDKFIGDHANDIVGRVLEIKNDRYTKRFGVGVTASDVLDIDTQNRTATIFADLGKADQIAPDTFDCFILTQTLQYVYEVKGAVFHAHRILKPGGVLLATVPTICRIDPELSDVDYWRFTPSVCRRLFTESFGEGNVVVSSFGNILSSLGSLHGMAQQEFLKAELDPIDSHFALIVGIRAVKARAKGTANG